MGSRLAGTTHMTQSRLTRHDYEEFLIYAFFPAGRNYLSRCISLAYADLQRTVRGIRKSENREKIRKAADSHLYEQFTSLQATSPSSREAFDQWHQQTCVALIDIYQKHGYQPFYVGQAQKWLNMAFKYVYTVGEQRISGYSKLYSFCHVPLDNYVISELRKYGFNLKPGGWSRIGSYDNYLSYQDWIREQFSESPLDLEFRLWLESRRNQ